MLKKEKFSKKEALLFGNAETADTLLLEQKLQKFDQFANIHKLILKFIKKIIKINVTVALKVIFLLLSQRCTFLSLGPWRPLLI